MATAAQISYIIDLLDQLGYDQDDYDLDRMTKFQAGELIQDLKQELLG